MTQLTRKTLKLLNMTKNEIFMTVRKIAFSVKLLGGLEIVLKDNSRKKNVPFSTIIRRSVSRRTRPFATKLSRPRCTFLVSAATFELAIKQNRHKIEFSENGKLRLDSRLKSGLDFISH